MQFEFATAGQVLFGPEKRKEIGARAAMLGRCALLVTGRDRERAAEVAADLHERAVAVIPLTIPEEPTIDMARGGTRMARTAGCDVVVGIGGGSVIDAAKAIAALMTNPGDPADYLEVIGQGCPLDHQPLPYIAVPTTAGTGAEVTRNAVLRSPEHGVKVSLRSARMLPTLAIVDPELTWSMPPAITAATGLDALTQVMEPFVSSKANPMTDAVCREGMVRAARSLRRAFADGSDTKAREDMALVGLFGGMALANAGLGAVHGFAAPIGGMFDAPHGAVCARLLPLVMQANVEAIRKRQPESGVLARYAEVARLLTGSASIEDGIAWVEETCLELGIPPLGVYGLGRSDVDELVERAKNASSMKGNPIVLDDMELKAILETAI